MPADPLPERREPKAKSAPRQDLLFVVSRDALDNYERLKGIFADAARVTVILDRRRGPRRTKTSSRTPERRRADRRSRPAIDDRMRRQGWAMVRLELSVNSQAQK
jgi:hypothetical protein